MQFLHDTHIDFMKYRKIWIGISLVLLVAAFIAVVVIKDVNLGIDFAGGTEITIVFRQAPNLDQLRGLMERAGLHRPEIQRFGKESENKVIIKTGAARHGSEDQQRKQIVAVLGTAFNQGKSGLDVNQAGAEALAEFLQQADPDGVGAQSPEAAAAHYKAVAAAINEARKNSGGLFRTPDALSGVKGVSAATAGALKQQAYTGDFNVLGVESVGPQVGQELRRQGLLAVVMSLVGMLAYIWLRFELRFGIGAVMAGLHDVLVTLGFFTYFHYEFNLTTVAAFLTLIGYSMNDTVVIFDRMRENMRKSRRKPLIEIMNQSINETLSRTIMTSGLTFLTVLSLLILGGPVLRGFAFVMTIGIIVGTYSSIYIASPFALLWEQLFGAQGKFGKAKKLQPASVEPPPGAKNRAAARR
jgi:preprotein translocase subunit SecF